MEISFIELLVEIGIIDMTTKEKITTLIEYYKGQTVIAVPAVVSSTNDAELMAEIARLTAALAEVEYTLKEVDELVDGYVKELPTQSVAVSTEAAEVKSDDMVVAPVDTAPPSFVIQYPSA
jgi:hypothetical protein